MSPFWIGIMIGLFMGVAAGFFAAALCVIGARQELQADLAAAPKARAGKGQA